MPKIYNRTESPDYYKVVIFYEGEHMTEFEVDTILFSFSAVFEEKARWWGVKSEQVERINLLKNETRMLEAIKDNDLADGSAIWSVYSVAQDAFCEGAVLQVCMSLKEVAHLLAILDTYGTFLYENASWSREV